MHDFGKVLLQDLLQITLGTASQHLGNESAAFFQNIEREISRRLTQRHDAEVVRLLVAG